MTATTIIAAVATNQHDHTVGHCRAQRQALYSCSEHCEGAPAQPLPKPIVSTAQRGEDDWTESQEELGRWGMQAIEATKADTSQATIPNEIQGGGLKFEDVEGRSTGIAK
ncbi:hypothetical protein TW65_00126 [Stemphylium lycopersici]|uniref:Uncharacterized protein n=1 Tax=Stemphylium lycopersici TaxID=183478 RepID=A0A364N4W8_STELY|nr:hypothetical protein TW65_00126 [Stemphylium lycopersici]RAR12144.1 hypothetical protein DDE83_004273 [Stemphylium lycopersici]